MNRCRVTGAAAGAVILMTLSACTGGKESNAAEEKTPRKNPIVLSQPASAQIPGQPAAEIPAVDAQKALHDINDAIPIYAGARFRNDLTRRDEVMIRNQYGPQTEVYTLATNDSYPQVYHYYTTYLAQFRAYSPTTFYPPDQQWRTLEVQLNQVMQDPFIPGDTLASTGKQVTLQIAETEAEPKTVIRYIVSPAGTPLPAGAAVPAVAGK